MSTQFTRRFTPTTPKKFRWLVLVGDEAAEQEVWMCVPCERTARALLRIPSRVPILIGCPPKG